MGEKKLELILEKLEMMGREQKATNARLEKIDQRLSNLEVKVDKIDQDLSATKEMVVTTAEKVTAIEETVNELASGQELLAQRQFESERALHRIKKSVK